MRDTRYEIGSALILAVVLTSLLAIVGVMFLMVARVDRMATSGISENKELDSAVETVIAKISQELVLDVPGVAGQPDYHDYPGPEDKWLASLEPYDADPNLLVVDPCWLQISDITGYLEYKGWPTQDIEITNSAPYLFKAIIEDHKEIVLDAGGNLIEQLADADGDGVADSKWIELDDITSNKGKPIFAAIRIIDNGAMLNVNTIYANIGGGDERRGDMLTDIYIDGLVKSSPTEAIAIANFLDNRSNAPDASTYYSEAARRIENPDTATGHFYTFYDIGEELSLRNRFILFPNGTTTRLEAGSAADPNRCLSTTLRATIYGNAYAPYADSDFDAWKRRLNPFDIGAFGDEPQKNNYDFRHLLTTYNMDRIINPVGQFLNQGKMVNVNTADKIMLYRAIWTGLYYADPNFVGAADIAAQIAVNLKDYSDNDANVSNFDPPPAGGKIYYGFERPCIYISELVYKEDVNDPNCRSYAIELYKPYLVDNYPDPNQWRLRIEGYLGSPIPIDWSDTGRFHVVLFEDPNAPLAVSPTASVQPMPLPAGAVVFDVGDLIELQRFVADANNYIVVDSVQVPDWLPAGAGIQSRQRDITLHKCIRRLWADASEPNSLGQHNNYPPSPDPDPYMIQAHPANARFTNVGEIGMIFREDVYGRMWSSTDTEIDVRLNLADPIFQQIFNYLTVFDPSSDLINNDGDSLLDEDDPTRPEDTPEFKIPGRININTAPWYVIAQLPWVSYHTPNFDLARAIVDYRDNTAGGFGSIGELNRVGSGDPNNYRSMGFYALDPNDLQGFPDLTPNDGDGALGNFEERDVIFARISNLVTVRSDVFTAYILVRIGTDGPQKRVIAILDRSNVYSGNDKVRIAALHPVPDPR